MTTRPLLQKVIDQLGLPYSVGGLRGMVGTSVVPNTPLMSVEARSEDPQLAATIANTLAEIFIQETQSSRLADIARLQALAEAQGAVGDEGLLRAQLGTLGSLTIVEPAIVPGGPFRPQVLCTTLIMVLPGILLGLVLMAGLEYFNRSLTSPDQVDKLFALSNMSSSMIGVMLRWGHKEIGPGELAVAQHPSSIYAEMFRQVRTGFQFTVATNPGKAFLVTSVVPSEGKTTVLANLGAVLAQGDNRVILVDSELHRPTMHRLFGLTRPSEGVSTLLANGHDPKPFLLDTTVPTLQFLPSGPIPANPADLLSSTRMDQIISQLKEECDFLLLDSPPIMASADPTILASKVDGVVMVVDTAMSRADSFQDAMQQIQKAGAPILGYIINKVKTRQLGYGHYRYRYYYHSYHSENGAEHPIVTTNGSRFNLLGKLPSLEGLQGKLRKMLKR